MEKDIVTELDKKSLTPADGQALAEKAPALLRQQFSQFPDAAEQTDKAFGGVGRNIRITGVGVGAVLGVASFTKFIPGKWKWVTGTTAVASGALGLMVGHKMDAMAKAFNYSFPAVKNAILKYADDIENNETIREQLADYLVGNITRGELATKNLDELVGSKAMSFGENAKYLDLKSAIDNSIPKDLFRNSNKAGCAISR